MDGSLAMQLQAFPSGEKQLGRTILSNSTIDYTTCHSECRVCDVHSKTPGGGAFSSDFMETTGFKYIISSLLLEHANYDIVGVRKSPASGGWQGGKEPHYLSHQRV